MSKSGPVYVCLALAASLAAAGCGDKKSSTSPTPVATATPTPTPVAAPKLTAPTPDSPVSGFQTSTLRPTLVVKNGTSDQPSGTRTYEFQVSDRNDFAASPGSFIGAYTVVVTKPGVAEGGSGTTSFTVDTDLQPTTRLYWRARMTQGTTTSDWSTVASFNTKLMGYSRAGELYDPLIHGETVGTPVGSTSFVQGKGIRLNNGQSFVKYGLPQTIVNGEFSMEVEGLAANAPGDKAKVFGMSEGDCTDASKNDFITNRYRVDIQYRGTTGVPPNAIQWRVLYGSATDLNVRYEPDTDKRFASVYQLVPTRTYYWKATWGTDFRLVVLDGGMTGSPLYDYGLPTPRGSYSPSPQFCYLGAPVGRSGTESASIEGTVYRNVWIGNKPRPASLGTALRDEVR